MEIKKTFESFITEASRRKVHKAAKEGSYPAVIVVVKDGKVIHQEPVSSPQVAPATFNVMQEKYPKAVLHLEDKTGKRLFSESIITEARAVKRFDKKLIDDKFQVHQEGAIRTIYKGVTGNVDMEVSEKWIEMKGLRNLPEDYRGQHLGIFFELKRNLYLWATDMEDAQTGRPARDSSRNPFFNIMAIFTMDGDEILTLWERPSNFSIATYGGSGVGFQYESVVTEEISPNAGSKIIVDKLIAANLIDKKKENKVIELLAYFIARGMHETSRPELGASRLVDKLIATKNLNKKDEEQSIDLIAALISDGAFESVVTESFVAYTENSKGEYEVVKILKDQRAAKAWRKKNAYLLDDDSVDVKSIGTTPKKDWDKTHPELATESAVNEAVSRATKIYQIATPAPKAMLVEELEELFGDDYRHIVTEFDDDEGYESVLVFNLSKKDILRIQNEIGDVLIWEYSIKKGKEISESVFTESVDMDYLDNAKEQLSNPHNILDITYDKTRSGDKFVRFDYENKYVPGKMLDSGPHFVKVFYDNNKDLNKISKELNIDLKESVTESVFSFKTDNIEQLHFETDPKTAEEMKIELGKMQGEFSKRKQIESGEYSLRRFRKEIGYGNGKDVGVFIPGSYDAAVSKLGDGPHKKAVKAVKWNQKKYDQWVEDMASNDGWKNAFDMAQNAKNEPGLLQWAKKEFRGEDVMQRIQWDIEALAESYNDDDINMVYGFYGTVTDNSNEKNAKKLFDQGIKDLKKKYRLTEEEALEVLNSKMGRKAADQIYDGQAKTAVEGLETYYGKTLHKELAEIQKSMVFDSTVTEAKAFNRAEVMDFLENHLKFVRTSEEFDGVEGGIWTSAENGETMGSSLIFDYYSTSSKYEFGVLNKFAKKLSKMGWYCEYYDPGTVMIWPI